MSSEFKVAIIYPYYPLYREPIVRLLCQQKCPSPEYTLISGIKGRDGIRTIDPVKAKIPVSDGGLKWRFVNNYWVSNFFLWQTSIVNVGISSEFNVIIFLGQYNFISTILSTIFARVTGKRVLMWSHGFIKDNKSLKNFVRKYFYKLSGGMLLYGNRARSIMINKGFCPESLYVVYNSLDYDLQKTIRESISELDLSHKKTEIFKNASLPVVIFVGRLTRQKKLDMIIKASKINFHSGNFYNILFVGDGDRRDILVKLCEEYDMLDYVNFYGSCYDEGELAKLIMLSDVCVSPGEVGLTAIHSLGYGTPVITHDDPSMQMPEYEAILDGRNGCFFRYGSIEDLALKIKKWLFNNVRDLDMKKKCISVVDEIYNPAHQVKIINYAVQGVSASEVARLVKS